MLTCDFMRTCSSKEGPFAEGKVVVVWLLNRNS